jgi:predicted DNA binding CopG/RHH family protein
VVEGQWRDPYLLDASDLAEWIRLKESGVSKKYSQELARRTMDAMHELSNKRLGKIKRQRSKDGLSYQETRLVLKADVELPGEVSRENMDDNPATDGVAGE